MTTREKEEALASLREDREQGASELARTALEFAARAAHDLPAADPAALIAQLRQLASDLSRTRPSMTPLATLTAAWDTDLENLASADLETVRRKAEESALSRRAQSVAACREAAARACQRIPDGSTVMTHSQSSTVAEVFRQSSGRGVSAIVTGSRPLCEGYRLAAILAGLGVPVTIITDAQMALSVKQADLALVGADSILPDGSVVNKAGTCLLALAAREHGIPFLVCAESFKQRTPGMPDLEFESVDPVELGGPDIPGAEVSNLYFDLTPAHLVTAILSEESAAL